MKVFSLRFADAKQLATVIKDLFPATDTNTRTGGGGGGGRFGGFGGFGGGGFPGAGGGPGGGGGTGGASGSSAGRPGASRVIASADEFSNSLIVSAPDDVMPTIEEMVSKVDAPVQDITEVRVFKLKNSDPSEMADLLANLFPDDSRSTDSNNRQQFRFGGGGFGGFGGGGNRNAAATESDRSKKKGRVLAVPDSRTSSIVVSAAHDLMVQIAPMMGGFNRRSAKGCMSTRWKTRM